MAIAIAASTPAAGRVLPFDTKARTLRPLRSLHRRTGERAGDRRASAGGQLALAVRGPPRRSEREPIDVAAWLQLFVDTAVRRALDEPAAVMLHVLVVVERRAANRDVPLRVNHD